MSRARPKPTRAARPPLPVTLAWLDFRGPILVPLLALLVTRVWLATQMPFASEDAYITFRYAWNFAQGAGPVFNPGEHVYGFTSAPWMAWLALGLRLGLDPLVWSRITLVAADVVTLVAFGSLLERHVSRTSARAFALMFALWPFCGALAMSGLEMSAFVALIALSGWLVDRRHPAAGVALGLLAVFRPEGVLAALVLAVWASRRDRLWALGLAAAVLGALTLYYGSPVPQSVRAKAITYGAPGPWHSMHWWEWILPVQFARDFAITSEGKTLGLFALLASPAAAAGAVTLWKARASALTGAALAAGAVWLSYIGVGASYFYWYLATPLFVWMTLVACGLPRIVSGRWIYVAATAALLGSWIYSPKLYIGRSNIEAGMFGGTGDYLSNNATPGASVLLEPIGTIGWKARTLKLIDEVGLVSPEVSRRRAAGAGWYTDELAAARPEWLVVRAGLFRRSEAFAGAGAPFRSRAEKYAALDPYRIAAMGDTAAGDENIVVMRRVAGR